MLWPEFCQLGIELNLLRGALNVAGLMGPPLSDSQWLLPTLAAFAAFFWTVVFSAFFLFRLRCLKSASVSVAARNITCLSHGLQW